MKKRITIIAFNKITLDTIFRYLSDMFLDYIDIVKYTTKDYLKVEDDYSELVLLSGVRTYEALKHKLEDKKIITGNRYIDYDKLECLTPLKVSDSVYLVNDQVDTTIESIRQLKEIGYEFKMIPFYPGTKVNSDIKIAITPGESNLVPESVKVIYDIGSRVSSISTISKIAISLDLSPNIIDSITLKYMSNYVSLLQRNRDYMEKLFRSDKLLENIFYHSKDGICLINNEYNITTVNNRFLEMFNLTNIDIIDKSIFKVFKSKEIIIDIREILGSGKVITLHGSGILISGNDMPTVEGKPIVIYANYTRDVKEKEILIRRNNIKPKRIHSFDDYITNDWSTLEMLDKAKKISKNDSCVLIQGESGTGKEIIAQSIHNNSKRKNENFVPINFAAIQPNLLESELFGYIAGSFTGSNKKGSKGLIETAHKGTIFFDEIGDAPLSFQVRLLRVLQEKEIRRVGDTNRTPVDIRVIVATNKNLMEMVKKGEFREDLYYRINVMPVDTIPLRDRKDDITLLLNYYIKIHFNNSDFDIESIFTEELKKVLLEYKWPGNVREIINITKYFACIKDIDKLSISDLPTYMHTVIHGEIEINLSEVEYDVLTIIRSAPKIGRYKICEQLQKYNHLATEGKIRTILKKLKEKELIFVNNTRGGCEITYKGIIIQKKLG